MQPSKEWKASRAAAIFFFLSLFVASANAQPSYEAVHPSLEVVVDAAQRRAQYLERVNEVLEWRAGIVERGQSEKMDLASVSANLLLGRKIDACSARVIEMMQTPGSGPFWMLPVVTVTFSGKNLLSQEAHAAIREVWRTAYQLRGDTENHFAMYYTMLYLMSEMYPNEPGSTWYTGKSSEENLAESREYLIDWMDLMTTVGQGEFNPTHYIGEYAIPMLFLVSWAEDPEMRLRGKMTLDWLIAGLAANTLNGVLRGPNSRTDDRSVVERWNSLASFFSWLNFGNCPPTKGFNWGNYYAIVAANYDVPEVIYRIATDREGSFEQRDLKRSRHRWRYSDVAKAPIYKTTYMKNEYAVGSYQGGMADPIQSHVWDVTWATPDPRGLHPTMFSVHPYSASKGMQMYFNVRPDTMVKAVAAEGKPSYDVADKLVGCSPYEQVFQDLDTIIALYDIPKGTRFEQVNGFFSKDLTNMSEDASGWIFAQGGDTYLAYYPMAPYHWESHKAYKRLPSTGGYKYERVDSGSQVLISPHVKNGTILQAASASEFSNFVAFQVAIRALPLEVRLEPIPRVKLYSLRGKEIRFEYGSAPVVNGKRIDYSKWKLFEGPYLNADKGSRKLVITHGRLKRTLDFNTMTISDSVVGR
ncbi:MAG: hypothetical protein O7C75_16135 [Verrucomicrobia bacterium]|nr:hypothetical protein [Verrucomicrobiota bacterium]